MENKKNFSFLLQRKEQFKKILMHIKELNSPESEAGSDVDESESLNKADEVRDDPQVEFYLNYQEMELLKYESYCLQTRMGSMVNLRDFFKVIEEHNIKSIQDQSFKLTMYKF